MLHLNKIRLLLLLVIITTSVFSSITVSLTNSPFGYELMYLHPITFLIMYILFINPTLKKFGFNIFLSVFILVSSTRYVFLPWLTVSSGWYTGRGVIHPTADSFENAILLMMYELIIYSFFIWYFHRKIFRGMKLSYKNEVSLVKNNLVYIVVFAFSLLLIILFPSSLSYFSFFSIDDSITKIGEGSFITGSIAMFLNVVKSLFALFIISKAYYAFHEKNGILFLFVSVTVVLLNTSIFFGTNRADFLFNSIGNILILLYLFRKIGLYISLGIALLIPLVISSITSYRNTVTITRGANGLVDLTDTFQVYLAGIYNVAMSLEMKYAEFVNPFFVFYDIFRSAMGPNLFLKNFDILTTSLIFNERIYHSSHVAQIVPMIGQGYYYFSFLFAPLIGITFIFIAIYLIKIIVKSKRIEIIYFLSIVSGRLGFVMAQNGSILINDLSFILPVFLVIYFFARKFN